LARGKKTPSLRTILNQIRTLGVFASEIEKQQAAKREANIIALDRCAVAKRRAAAQKHPADRLVMRTTAE
jgi:hypothetical protein